MRESKWYRISVCCKCEEELSNHQEYYSRGVCPYCGHDGNSTILETKQIVIKEIKHYPWWYIFNRKKTYRGKDEFSNNWLNKL